LRIGTISFGAPETFAHDFLPDFLLEFSKEYPNISFRISVATQHVLVEQLVRDDIEVAMIYNPPVRAALQVVAHIQKPTCVMARLDHPLAKRSSIRLADCAPYRLVMPEYGTRAREVYDEMLGKVTIEPQWSVTTTSYEMLRSMAHAGLGIAIVSDYVAARKRMDDVVFVPIRDCPPSIVACCVRSGRGLSAAATLFTERVTKLFGRLKRRQGE
jgi:DNA-binding transcriptional LysR family regulator